MSRPIPLGLDSLDVFRLGCCSPYGSPLDRPAERVTVSGDRPGAFAALRMHCGKLDNRKENV